MKKRKNSVLTDEKGFTLLETAIAISILAIALMGLAHLLALALHQNSFARYNSVAVNLAQAKLEELRTTYNSDLENETSSQSVTAGSHGPETVTVTSPDYTNQADWQFLVSWEVADSGQSQKSVTVSVNPQNQNQLESKTIAVTSHFSP
ncbi:MAG: prepilin-type N-terminal cleavage/methylation domain-containing protein [Acidobacteriota bacterium]